MRTPIEHTGMHKCGHAHTPTQTREYMLRETHICTYGHRDTHMCTYTHAYPQTHVHGHTDTQAHTLSIDIFRRKRGEKATCKQFQPLSLIAHLMALRDKISARMSHSVKSML